jgi:hypothetical protein
LTTVLVGRYTESAAQEVLTISTGHQELRAAANTQMLAAEAEATTVREQELQGSLITISAPGGRILKTATAVIQTQDMEIVLVEECRLSRHKAAGDLQVRIPIQAGAAVAAVARQEAQVVPTVVAHTAVVAVVAHHVVVDTNG